MTLLSILVDLNNAVVWITAILLSIFISSNPFSEHLGTVPCASTITGITVNFMCHRFFFRFLSLYLFYLIFPLWFIMRQVRLFVLSINFGILAEIS